MLTGILIKRRGKIKTLMTLIIVSVLLLAAGILILIK